MKFEVINVEQSKDGLRLDSFMSDKLKQSRNSIQKLIGAGHIHLNEESPKKSGVKLKTGDRIAYRLPAPAQKHKAEDIPLDIIHEDENLIVINKPAGIVVHPDRSGHSTGTIVNAILAHCKKSGDTLSTLNKARPGIVHRLDKDTSGALLIAKNNATHERLSKLFQDRKVEKTYLALVEGHPKTKEGRIEASIKRDSKHRQQMAISKQGKAAITTFKIKDSFKMEGLQASLLEVKIETGRTHQIRLHLASIGHPVLGDEKYGDPAANKIAKEKLGLTRQFLHAAELKIDKKTYKAALPNDLLTTLHHVQ